MERENKAKKEPVSLEGGEEQTTSPPLCREPWESYYILRRGILPCCHGSQPIAPMSEWETGWNSARLQEIRRYLSQGKLSPYCLDSLSCPIVQRYLAEQKGKSLFSPLSPQQRPPFFRFLNRVFFGLPGRAYRALRERREK